MKQIDIINAYTITEKLSENENLSINCKWVLYKLRKELLPHYEFYIEESRKLLNEYETEINGSSITFKSEALAKEYQSKQDVIDKFEVEFESTKRSLKLSDIPNITIQQIETLDKFIEFIPE